MRLFCHACLRHLEDLGAWPFVGEVSKLSLEVAQQQQNEKAISAAEQQLSVLRDMLYATATMLDRAIHHDGEEGTSVAIVDKVRIRQKLERLGKVAESLGTSCAAWGLRGVEGEEKGGSNEGAKGADDAAGGHAGESAVAKEAEGAQGAAVGSEGSKEGAEGEAETEDAAAATTGEGGAGDGEGEDDDAEGNAESRTS